MTTGEVIDIIPANLLTRGKGTSRSLIAIIDEDVATGETPRQSWIPLTENVKKGNRVGITKQVTYSGQGSQTTYRLVPLKK